VTEGGWGNLLGDNLGGRFFHVREALFKFTFIKVWFIASVGKRTAYENVPQFQRNYRQPAENNNPNNSKGV